MFKVVRLVIGILSVILTVTRPYADKSLDIIYRIVLGPTPKLPPIDDKILLMSATELAEKIRKRKFTCEEVMKAYIRRIKQIQPLLNVYEEERFDDALKEAKDKDAVLNSGSKSEEQLAEETPLFGVPFSCKESIGVKGLVQAKGLVRFKDRKAPDDAKSTKAYRKAGAIPVAVTNVPELCMWWETTNHIFGTTINPYNRGRTVGGSSGGEGAMLTSAGAVIGIGSDIAGSIRIPSSFCGIYGHKGTRDLIPLHTTWPYEVKELAIFRSVGPMCRYVQDLPLLVRILAEENVKKVRLDEKVDFRKVKIYYMEEFPGFMLSTTPDVKAAVRKAAKHFEDEFGVTATKLYIEELKYALKIWGCKFYERGAPPFKDRLAGPDRNIKPTWELIKCLFQCSEYTLPSILQSAGMRSTKKESDIKYLKMYQDLERKLEETLRGDAILLLPTHRDPPPHILVTIPKVANIVYTCIFNILGFPCTQIPGGLSNGLPIGIQAVSYLHNDHLTLAAAVELDKVFGGWVSPGPMSV